MTTQPSARALLVIASGITLLIGLGNVAQAAIPTNSTAITVSATVLPTCNDTSCRNIPKVVSYEPSSGINGTPAFGMVSDIQRIMTITY